MGKVNRYRVTFDRIGRDHDVAPLDVVGENDSEVAFHVHQYARPRLTSNDVTVNVDLDAMKGQIFIGFRVAGTFTLSLAD